MHEFSRSELLIGIEGVERLKNSRVAIFGVGGVGSFTAEAIARSGVGHIDLFDNDVVTITNINRQLVATHSTIGLPKVEIMRDRIKDINPNAEVEIYQMFYLPETAEKVDFTKYDYIVDAIDTVSAKLSLVQKANEFNIPIISAMGGGNKFDPTKFVVTDIYKTMICPLAKVMRSELRKRGIEKLKVVYSTEEPKKPVLPEGREAEVTSKRSTPGTVSFVPPVLGMIVAGEVIKDLIGYGK